jgi:hypothetical protein
MRLIWRGRATLACAPAAFGVALAGLTIGAGGGTGAPDEGAAVAGALDSGSSDSGASDSGASDSGASASGAEDAGAESAGAAAAEAGAAVATSLATGGPGKVYLAFVLKIYTRESCK